MADPGILADRLDEYLAALRRDRRVVDERFGRASRAFQPLGRQYSWETAKEFQRQWARTEQAFKDYSDGVMNLEKLLLERIRALRDLQRTRL